LLHDDDPRVGGTRRAVALRRAGVGRELRAAVVPYRARAEPRRGLRRPRRGAREEQGNRQRRQTALHVTSEVRREPLQVLHEGPFAGSASACLSASASAPSWRSKKWLAPGTSTSCLGSAQVGYSVPSSAGGATASCAP